MRPVPKSDKNIPMCVPKLRSSIFLCLVFVLAMMVPASLKPVNILVESLGDETFEDSEVSGYRIASCCSDYGGVRQRWLVIESELGRVRQLKHLEKRLNKKLTLAQRALKRLMKQDFACVADAEIAAQKLSRGWKYHLLESLTIDPHLHYAQVGRPCKDQEPADYLSCHCVYF